MNFDISALFDSGAKINISFHVRMLEAGCWILDAGSWMLDAGCWKLDVWIL
jgi:hypothetical protein